MDVDEPPAAAPPARPPFLHVVKGEPTPEELAALAVALAARRASAQAPAPAAAASVWASREVPLRRPLHPGPDAWRAAALVPGTRTRAAP